MSENEYNKVRLPGNVFDKKLHDPVPPYNVRGETTEIDYRFTYFDPNKTKNSSKESMESDGSYRINASSKKKAGYTVENTNEKREYNSGGSSKHSDGHQAKSGEATGIENTKGETSRASGGADYGQFLRGMYNCIGGAVYGCSGTSSADKYTYVSGTSTTRQDGDRFEHIDGDTKFSIGGSKYETVGAEYGKNIQGGNFDIQVDAGKARLKVSNEILIESGEKITLKVGSSTITITSGNIVIQSARVDINP